MIILPTSSVSPKPIPTLDGGQAAASGVDSAHFTSAGTTPPPMKISTQLHHQHWDFGDLVLKSRMLEAMSGSASRYPICRSLRFAAREKLPELLDRYATAPGWRAQRLHATYLLLEADGLFVSAHGNWKSDYCSCSFTIWADSAERADRAVAQLSALAENSRIHDAMFSIDWHFLTSKGELESAEIEELADDRLFDSAYPEIPGGVHAFIDRYLDAEETVLIVQGPPGTGKTRLIRAILGAMSRRRSAQCRALYTGDTKCLENDEIFVKFITGWDDAFVVEDADHLLKPRAEGNEHLHRFLTIADGVVRAQGRKIIFSTNLPNVGDLDDALIRPGRCFARLNIRELSHAEGLRIAEDLRPGDAEALARVRARLETVARRSVSLATIYSAINHAR
jgi:hypothetical protein